MRVVALSSLVVVLAACSAGQGERPTMLPARFEEHRIFLSVATRNHDTLNLYTDTGGGLFVLGHVADRFGWPDSTGVDLRQVALREDLPVPLGSQDSLIPIFRPAEHGASAHDGMLGQAWFADRVWEIDYGAKTLSLHAETPRLGAEWSAVALGFLTDSLGARVLSFPRMPIVVDGDTLQMLLDTGATGHLTTAAHVALGDGGPLVRATSFITSEVFGRWRARHPSWRVVPAADSMLAGMAMIEVPVVSVAGVAVGPVWFMERPDANFHTYMAQWMDRPVDGALGGNAFRFFRTILDYPGSTAHFLPIEDRR